MAKRKGNSDIEKLLKNIRKRRSKISKQDGKGKKTGKRPRPRKKSGSPTVKRRETGEKHVKKTLKTRETSNKKNGKPRTLKRPVKRTGKIRKPAVKKVKKQGPVKKPVKKNIPSEMDKKKVKRARIKRVVRKIIKRVKPPSDSGGIPREYLLETDIDKLYQAVSEKGMIKVNEASRMYRVPKERIEEWGRILEEHDLAILHYPPFGDPFLLLKKYKKSPKIRKKSGRKKKPLIINLVILTAFVLIVLNYTGRLDLSSVTGLLPPEFISALDLGNLQRLLIDYWIYLLGGLIIIIALVILIKIVKKRGKGRKK